jgi:hypothetical protein
VELHLHTTYVFLIRDLNYFIPLVEMRGIYKAIIAGNASQERFKAPGEGGAPQIGVNGEHLYAQRHEGNWELKYIKRSPKENSAHCILEVRERHVTRYWVYQIQPGLILSTKSLN